MGWIMDAVSAAREVRKLRKIGIRGKIIIMLEEDLILQSYETAVDRKQNRLLYQCVEDMAHGRSRCRYCEEYPACKNDRKGDVRGCSDWWLRFLTEDEEKECRGIFDGNGGDEDEREDRGDSQGTADHSSGDLS